MKSLFVVLLLAAVSAHAQTDSASVVVEKDARVDLLIKKQAQINQETTRDSRRNIPGYRIQVINSSDRNKVFKPYLIYQAPNYKLKLGNFKTAEEAEPYLQQLTKLFPTGVYVIHDIIEVKPDKPNE